MFSTGWVKNTNRQVKKRIICGLICLSLVIGTNFLGLGNKAAASWDEMEEVNPKDLIRFHVIANSDSEEDQLLKYMIRDEILKEVAPILAKSASLDESRRIIQEMQDEFLAIAEKVIKEWGKDYQVTLDYGIYNFPTKSYGSIVLPGDEYEAVKIMIGEAQGANWWCVLFPPLCFVNTEEVTTLPVDGKPGVPLEIASKTFDGQQEESFCNATYKGKKVGFYFERFLK